MKFNTLTKALAIASLSLTFLATASMATGYGDGGYDGECNLKVKKETARWYKDSHRDNGKFVGCHEGYSPISCMVKFDDKDDRNRFWIHEAHPTRKNHDNGCFFRVGSSSYHGHEKEFKTWTVCIPESCIDEGHSY